MNVFEKLRDVVAITLKVPANEITETTQYEDIAAWDSLAHLNLVMAVEQTFNVLFDVEDFPTLNSIPAIMEHLRQRAIE